jgi:hypothetical protein
VSSPRLWIASVATMRTLPLSLKDCDTPMSASSHWPIPGRGRHGARCRVSDELDNLGLVPKSIPKPRKSGGLETNGLRERIRSRNRLTAVGRFRTNVRGYWSFARAQIAAENVGREQAGGGRGTGIQHSPLWDVPKRIEGPLSGANQKTFARDEPFRF